jgi:predicted aldo/keto reductase-like oxidoreductase
MPCPYGIDIPEIFAHYNRIVNAGDIMSDENLQNPNGEEYRKARRTFLLGYDRSVPKLRQADHCIGCGICNPHCPQRIDIPKEMQRIDGYAERLKQGG